ncbi:MAG TPA: C39 family peptidase [Chthoniobacterales bacterium]|nr:C39 family peptidase [Chthoniobacterales bacterium]
MQTEKIEGNAPATKFQTGRHRKPILIAGAIVLILLSIAALSTYYFGRREISASGGLYFFSRIELNVPRFAQGDPRWAEDLLGPTESTMGSEGCAVSSAAMVLAYYGISVDPGALNTFLADHDGYTPQGWLYWEKAAAFAPGKAKHVYEDAPSYYLVDSNLLRGNPVIVRLRLTSGVTHFVVIVGKRGFHYLIQDPGSTGEGGIYPLYRLVSKIDGLRFYEKLAD